MAHCAYNGIMIGSTANEHVIYIPANHNVTGTCGKCGGPIIQPMMWSGTDPRPEWCNNCNSQPKKPIAEAWGPLREMD